jgi:hypothetical protein
MAFYIESGTGRRIDDPAQADPTKTYVESGTGRQVPGSQLRGQTQPPTPTTPPAPSAPATPTTPPLPPIPQTGNGLVDFSNALSAAADFAKRKRNALSLDMMMPSRGVAPASDFSSILSNLNSASDSLTEDITKNLTETATPELLSVEEARILGVPYGTTKEEAASLGVVPQYKDTDGGGSKNSLTLSEAKSLGLPLSIVGMSEEEILSDVSAASPPVWFKEIQEQKMRASITPAQLQAMWKAFQAEVDAKYKGDDDDLALPSGLGK